MTITSQKTSTSAIQFISKGIACHAMCLVYESGLLKKIVDKGSVSINCITDFPNPSLMYAALISMCDAGILTRKKKFYEITTLGRELSENIGLVTVPLVGYRALFANQFKLLMNPDKDAFRQVNHKGLADASTDFGKSAVDTQLVEMLHKLHIQGAVCDLGCGSGHKLSFICSELKAPGLGIEICPDVVASAKAQIKKSSEIEIIQGDVTNLQGQWLDVTTVMTSYVFHDINPSAKCSRMLKSFRTTFPRMKTLIIIDIVSMSEAAPTIMPGFDYVHGLQGIKPRTYEDTMEVFEDSGYTITEEISMEEMPNTFIWVLSPGRS